MRKFPDQVDILHEDRATLPGCEGVLVVGNRNALIRGEGFLGHGLFTIC